MQKWVKMLAWEVRSKVNKRPHGSIPLLAVSFTFRRIFKNPYIMCGICCFSRNTSWSFCGFASAFQLCFLNMQQPRGIQTLLKYKCEHVQFQKIENFFSDAYLLTVPHRHVSTDQGVVISSFSWELRPVSGCSKSHRELRVEPRAGLG